MVNKLPAKPVINLTANKPLKLSRAAVVVGSGANVFKLPANASIGQLVGIGNVGPQPKRK